MAEFDSAKGAFLLVAMIIATMMVMMIFGMGTCTWLAIAGHPMPVCEDLKDFAKEIITMAFTAAIAFAGGRASAPGLPLPKLPEREPERRVSAVVPQHRKSKAMTKYKGKDVSVRELKQDDVSFANRFDAAKPQVVIRHIDGREEVVAKDQLDAEGQDQGQTGQKPGQGGQGGQGRQST